MGCNCKGNSSKDFKEDFKDSNFSNKGVMYYLLTLLGTIIIIPVGLFLSIRSIFTGKPIDITNIVKKYLIKEKETVNNEQ